MKEHTISLKDHEGKQDNDINFCHFSSNFTKSSIQNIYPRKRHEIHADWKGLS